MYAQERPPFTMAVAVVGACLIVIPPVLAPAVQRGAAEFAAAGDLVALTSSHISAIGDLDAGDSASVADALAFGGGALSSVTAGMAEADPLGDLWTQAQQFFSSIVAGGFAFLFFGGIYVGSLIQSAWNWIADLFGFDPYPYTAEALATAVPDLGDPGIIDPVGIADVTAALSDWTTEGLADPVDIDPGLSGLLPDIGI